MKGLVDSFEYGYKEGELCNRGDKSNQCCGIIALHEVEGCSCHINPPCAACTAPHEYCPVCGWEASND